MIRRRELTAALFGAAFGAAAVAAVSRSVVPGAPVPPGMGAAGIAGTAGNPVSTPPDHVGPSSSTPVVQPGMPGTPVRIAPAEAKHLDLPGLLSAEVGGAISPDPRTDLLVPPTSRLVYRWADRGRPGSDTPDTVYLLGHTVRAGGGVFDRLQQVSVGQPVLLVTGAGRLNYDVTEFRLFARDAIRSADEVYAAVPGRLVLISCFLNQDGSRQDRNLVVFSQLRR